jgi:hypothetical protein
VFLGRVTTQGGRTKRFTVRMHLRRDDKLVLLRTAVRANGIPRLTKSATATRKLGAR